MHAAGQATDVVLTRSEPAGITDPTTVWGFGKRLAFRFVFAYFALYIFPFPLNVLPYTSSWTDKYDAIWIKFVPWFGSHVLHLAKPITVLPNGSGDTTFDYVFVLVFLILAVVATVVWSLLDRKRSSYVRLYQWFRLYMRMNLGAAMITYGTIKVIPAQMPAPGLSTLVETYGESSPMRLLWTMMGASKAYEIFAGTSELLGAVLLFVPALTALGSLILLGVLTNVFMLNMCYDVPVKLYSFHLLMMALFLAAPELRRLADLFIFHCKVQLSSDPPLFRRAWLNRGILVLQLIFGVFLVGYGLHTARQQYKQFAARPPLYGLWTVEEFTVDGIIKPPLQNDAARWRTVIFDFPQRMTVQLMTGTPTRYILKIDEAKKTLGLANRVDPDKKSEMSYQQPEANVMLLAGTLDGHRVTAKVRREDDSNFLLTNRGFHWINEYPYNR